MRGGETVFVEGKRIDASAVKQAVWWRRSSYFRLASYAFGGVRVVSTRRDFYELMNIL